MIEADPGHPLYPVEYYHVEVQSKENKPESVLEISKVSNETESPFLPKSPDIPNDRVTYEEEIIYVRTKPAASSPLARSKRPQTRRQTGLNDSRCGAEYRVEENASSKSMERASKKRQRPILVRFIGNLIHSYID